MQAITDAARKAFQAAAERRSITSGASAQEATEDLIRQKRAEAALTTTLRQSGHITERDGVGYHYGRTSTGLCLVQVTVVGYFSTHDYVIQFEPQEELSQ